MKIKARVGNLGTIRAALQQKGMELSEPVTQHDVVWGRPGVVGYNEDPWLRLRTETKGELTRYVFTLKRSVTGQLDSIEHETEVNDPKAVEGIVHELGFTLFTSITKTRQKAHLGEIEICLDSVEGLGDFIEAEKLTEDGADYQKAVDELWTLLESVGIDHGDEITDGYDTLMNKKLGKE